MHADKKQRDFEKHFKKPSGSKIAIGILVVILLGIIV